MDTIIIFTEMSFFCHHFEVIFVKVAGIIVEYNPLHIGHVRLLKEVRRLLGEDTAIICIMSGDFVQRGDFALVRRQMRAGAAVQGGADLVLELPLPWAVSSAERFADGGVRTLLACGVADVLAFGSECGDGAALRRLASALLDGSFPILLRRELKRGDSFAAARQRAAAGMLSPADAALLENPNDILGVEYCKSLLRHGAELEVLAIRRTGAAHDEPAAGPGQSASAAGIRSLLREGRREEALSRMAPAMRTAYETEEAAGRAPVFFENCQRAVLARLRSMTEEDFAALDEGREGLYRRLYRSARSAASLEEALEGAKTRRCAYARLRRMTLWAYLGLRAAEFPVEIPYLRPLAANQTGRTLLARMRKTASVPVLTKPAGARRLSGSAQALFAREAMAADLYALAYPELSAASGGSLWREGPLML